ncbi:unnamed protein product [Penicillium salamii]|uniref:Mediator of RNA polymerase II transcription subunit 18 n=1 Tax=Penicillium salamii TaxID=1612424 RepID=A0A9W4IYY7_9EURO|nr:unnamed protein product [Penicillium salamii]CAG8260040.1 unnamed protein product [Penicillium salamii]CAG8315190.1 unnamed protein product [Penicillium salamii]CAG8359360.1 unnamed protein product [Penicillium salamii]CAG8367759.1 unnamed protein product [Penicillium salamii]
MHEQSLFASVPAHQHHELLQQLAGLTAMQPRHCLERRLIFKAFRKPGLAGRTGASQDLQQGDMQRLNKMLNGNTYYTQAVGPVTEADFGSSDSDAQMIGTEPIYDYGQQPWKLEFRDIPEAGTRSAVTSRLMSSAVLPRGNVIPLMFAWGYNFKAEFVVEGDMFVHNDIAIFVHRVLQYPDESSQPREILPAFKDMTLLEESGSYVLQAFITVQDGSNQETMKTASQHLFGLREQLKSAVRLEQADRLSLDTRAK